jgi:hypothetical protein
MQLKLVFLALLTGILSFATPAYAYLDPGSASLVVQGIIAAIAAITGAAALYWDKTKQFFRSLFRTKNRSASPENE